MIKVLEHGVRKVTCPNCKAKLQYEQEDVIMEKRPNGKKWIMCPDCGYEITINKPITRDDFDLGITV
jgi:RNase P subunit RPR2